MVWLSDNLSLNDLARLGNYLENATGGSQRKGALGVVLVTAPWVAPRRHSHSQSDDAQTTRQLIEQLVPIGLAEDVIGFGAICRLEKDDDISLLVGDDSVEPIFPIPPSSLPALAVVSLLRAEEDDDDITSITQPSLQYTSITSATILKALANPQSSSSTSLALIRSVQSSIQQFEAQLDLSVTSDSCSSAIRIFIAGDRSSVGKSSVCLGIIGSLLRYHGYTSEDLAYIKPATQSESKQLIQVFCESQNIECVPIGPLVYYRGFTRAYLAGETPTSEELLETCARAVDRIARGKKIVLVDGVGFPAVGSICGTDNASVLKACSYPIHIDSGKSETELASTQRQPMGVVLVGGSGVGAAVDAYNLNATYFASKDVSVIGTIFNKLSLTGFYSLENCKEQITRYFDLQAGNLQKDNGPTPQAFGFVPMVPEMNEEGIDDFIDLFSDHVDVPALVAAASLVKGVELTLPQLLSMKKTSVVANKNASNPAIRIKANRKTRSRSEIEQEAVLSGAKKSA
jgi:hypothetical protein